MKKILFLLACCLMTIGMQAENTQKLTINGEEVQKVVTRMTFEGNNVVLHFDDQTQQSADMSTVVLSFTWDGAGIYTVKQPVGDLLSLKGIAAGDALTIYDAAGKRVMTTTAEHAAATLSTKSLTPGVYMLKVGRQVVKFVKR